ncbi:MAG TPA: hypothetical protein ENN55_01795, partial [Firmicutes bacterium]|nr:hypothetical protein [Bacillota bacterium]
MLKRMIFMAAAMIAAIPVFAAYEKGGIAVNGAEASALGGAFAAQKGNLFSVFHNPAGLYDLGGTEAGAGYGDIANTKKGSVYFAAAHYFAPYFTSALFASKVFVKDTGEYEDF